MLLPQQTPYRSTRHMERSIDIRFHDHTPDLGRNLPEARWLRHKRRADILHASARVIDKNIEVPEALDSARKSSGPARIIVHPNGDVQ